MHTFDFEVKSSSDSRIVCRSVSLELLMLSMASSSKKTGELQIPFTSIRPSSVTHHTANTKNQLFVLNVSLKEISFLDDFF